MKSHVIHWKSRITGTVGTGTKLFEREKAKNLAAELNEEFPDIDHEAVLRSTEPVQPAVDEQAPSSNG